MSTSGWEVDDGGETGVFIGMTVPLLVLTGIGAWVSTDAALSDPMGRISSLLGGGLPAVVALIALGTSLAVGNAFNDFSGGRDCPRLVNHLLSACLSG